MLEVKAKGQIGHMATRLAKMFFSQNIHVVDISKTNQDRAMVTTESE